MKKLILIDDFLPETEHEKMYNLTLEREWISTNDMEEDDPNSGVSGYMSSGNWDDEGTQILVDECSKYDPLYEILHTDYKNTIYNKYPSNCPTYFHVDVDPPETGWTILYFQDINDYNFQMGGETQIFSNNSITGILPIPNRLIAFEGSLWHKGTSFNGKRDRYSFALQFSDN